MSSIWDTMHKWVKYTKLQITCNTRRPTLCDHDQRPLVSLALAASMQP